MSPLVVLAALAVASSAPIVVAVALTGKTSGHRVSRNLTAGLGAHTDLRRLVLAQSARERAVRPFLAMLAGKARRLTPSGVVRAIDHRLELAGEPWSIERVLAAKLVLAGLATGASLAWTAAVPSPAAVLLVPVAILAGWLGPDAVVASRAEARQRRILDDLPDTLDQLTICVEAGLAFDAALSRVARSGRGPLGDEVRRVLQDVQIGIPRADALHRLLERTDVAELRQFVHAISQAETYGMPVATVLRTQAAEQRQKRCSRAEERAQKLPVKLVFPLVLCILPALFVVVLGPAALRVMRIFG